MNQRSKDLMNIAADDLFVAEHLFNDIYPKKLSIICFHCQQCGEKAIKAVISEKHNEYNIPKSHDLTFLFDYIKNYVDISSVSEYGDLLSQFSTIPRYTNEILVDEDLTKLILKEAKEIFDWANSIID